MILQVTLPWPARELWPNARVHWRRKHAAMKSYNRTAWVLARRALGARGVPSQGQIVVRLEFLPPNRIRRDLDNLVAAMKSAIDGVALALGVDDARFGYEVAPLGVPIKGGRVRVAVVVA